MKLNQTAMLVVVGALAAIAVGLWATKSPPPKVVPAKPAPAKVEVAPVAPPAPKAAPAVAPMGAQDLALPINPTQTGELPALRQAWAFYEPIEALPTLEKFYDVMIRAAGGEAVQKSLLAAKWKLTVTLPGRTVFLEMLTDAQGNIKLRDEQTGVEWFLVGDECRIRHDKLVSQCLHETEEFVHGIQVAQMSAVPLRFKQTPVTMEDVIDGKFLVRVALPAVAEHFPIRVEMSRETGTVTHISWCTVTAFPTLRHGDDEWKVPDEWTITWAPEQQKNGKGDGDKPKTVKTRVSVRSQEVTPIKDKTPLKLPALTVTEPLSVVSRPALTGVVLAEGARVSGDKVAHAVVDTAKLEGQIDLLLGQLFAPAQEVTSLEHGALTMLLMPSSAAAHYAKTLKIHELPAEPRVARKVVRSSWSDLPDQMVKFIGEVNQAGHKPGTGPTLVLLLPSEGHDEFVAELQVPLAPK